MNLNFSKFYDDFKLFCKKETNIHTLTRFSLLISVIVIYLIFISLKFGAENGFLITLLTWSFFVFCTPVADAGFLVDFPVRLITKMRMLYSEMIVWVVALLINIFTFLYDPTIYDKTLMLQLFHHIITKPFPYWGIIVLSAIGTFLSIYFGDELLDVSTHSQRQKYHKHVGKMQLVIFLFIIALILILYDFLLKKIGIHIAL